jgi:formamidopyrimidine-DNA glycosylase
MPELPEVETVVRDLRAALAGLAIQDILVSDRPLRHPWQPEWHSRLVGRRIVTLDRRAKWIIVNLDDASRLGLHLGMTGQLCVVDAERPPETHTHLRFRLSEGRELRFRDIRRFGGVVYLPPGGAFSAIWESGLGPEPWDIDPSGFAARLQRSRRAIKAWLLDQSQVAGVGNIYADESLFAARIWPGTPAHALTRRQAARLHRALNDVLRQAIDSRGTTIRNYVGGSGLRGGFQDQLQVYGRSGLPCRRCRARVARIRIAGRSTHFCPKCQPRGRVVAEAD